MLTFLAMVIAGGTGTVCSCTAILAISLMFFGCGERRLTAITDAPASGGMAGAATNPTPDACAPERTGLLPPLGWNGWNEFRCRAELDQTKFYANVDALVGRGLKDAGYTYANLDDCWQAPRGDGALTASARFPDGIAQLGRYVHARGLKLGIDTHAGACRWPELTTPSSAGHEAQDAAAFSAWGVDYVKYTDCSGDPSSAPSAFRVMREALAQAGRSMLFSVVSTPFAYWELGAADLWRTHGDIEPTWDALLDIIDTQAKLAAYSGQTGLNDADMLWVGNPALTESEARAHFSMWAAFASPLLAGNDLTQMSDATAAILTNRGVLELDQDPLVLQAVQLDQQGDVGVYAKPLSACGARGVVLLNRGAQPADASVSWQALGLAPGDASVRDLWADSELGPTRDVLRLTVPAHDVRALRISGNEPALPRGSVYLSDLKWSYAANGWGPVELDRELGDKAAGDGKALSLGGVRYAKGLGMNSPALVRYRLGKACQTLSAVIGIDDNTGDQGSAVFQVWADGEKLFDSGVMDGAAPPRHIDIDVTGRTEVRLFVGEVEDIGLDHADWADARLSCDP